MDREVKKKEDKKFEDYRFRPIFHNEEILPVDSYSHHNRTRGMQQTAKLLIDDSGYHVDLKNSINNEFMKRDQFSSRTEFIPFILFI